jgi:glycosyltransferase involved in cell wall biosynthesis
MRIARVMTRINLGGPARQALASDSRLSERGHHVRLFAGVPEAGEGDLFEEFRARGLDVVRVSQMRRGISPARDLLARRFLRREIARFAPDVLHTHASKAGSLGRTALAGSAALAGVARVHTFHGHVLEGYFPAAISRRLIAHEARLARTCDRIVAVSHATADDLVRLGVVAEERLVVIPPGVELAGLLAIPRAPAGEPRAVGPLRELLGVTREEILVGVIGRLAEVKRPEIALAVFQLLAPRYERMHLVFVGDGELFGALAKRIGGLAPDLARRAHMTGARSDVVEIFAELDVVLLTSRTEGLPVALIEAGAAGLPVVATDVGGVGEVVAHERTGFLGAGADELAFARATLLDRPEERRAMGARARLRVAARPSPEVLASRLEELYGVVVEERRARARAERER